MVDEGQRDKDGFRERERERTRDIDRERERETTRDIDREREREGGDVYQYALHDF